MRIKLFFLIVVVLTCSSKIFAQPYYKLLKDGRNWIYTQMVSGEDPPVHIVLAFALSMQGDTILQDISYKKIYLRTLKKNAGSTAIQNPKEILNTYLYGLMREDTVGRKVYLLPFQDIVSMCQPDEHLLYDFSLQEGDTLNECVLENLYLEGYPDIPRIDSIRESNYFGLSTRAFFTQGFFDNYGDLCYCHGLLLEGYGYERHGLINYGRNGYLVCFQYFCEGDSLDCELLSAVQEPQELSKSLISFSPNPTSDILTIQIDPSFRSETDLQVSLLYTVGNVMQDFTWNILKELQMDLSDLPEGIYFLNVHDQSMSVVKKIVIAH